MAHTTCGKNGKIQSGPEREYMRLYTYENHKIQDQSVASVIELMKSYLTIQCSTTEHRLFTHKFIL
jgi:hypothetical protein